MLNKSTILVAASAWLMACCTPGIIKPMSSVPVATSGAPKSDVQLEYEAEARYITKVVDQIRRNSFDIKDCRIDLELRQQRRDVNIELMERMCEDLTEQAAELYDELVQETHKLDKLQKALEAK